MIVRAIADLPPEVYSKLKQYAEESAAPINQATGDLVTEALQQRGYVGGLQVEEKRICSDALR